jgi:hypothetical protein
MAPKMTRKTIKFSGGQMKLILRDVLVVNYRKDREITEDDMLDQRYMRKELIGDMSYYPIVDLSDGVVTFSDEAKAWVAVNKKSSSVRICDILLVKGAVMKFKARFYTLMFKPTNRTVIVTSMQEALDFIEQDRKKRNQKIMAEVQK